MGQINRLARFSNDETQDREFVSEVCKSAFIYSESLALRIGVHEALFRNVIQMLGNKEQQEHWIPHINAYRVIGCFSMVK